MTGPQDEQRGPQRDQDQVEGWNGARGRPHPGVEGCTIYHMLYTVLYTVSCILYYTYSHRIF